MARVSLVVVSLAALSLSASACFSPEVIPFGNASLGPAASSSGTVGDSSTTDDGPTTDTTAAVSSTGPADPSTSDTGIDSSSSDGPPPMGCGDGVVAGTEACDDDNTVDGDGCTACTVDPGFRCMGVMPSVCVAPCGNGVVDGAEICDDGDAMAGDGCAADCTVELYYRCSGAGPGSCAPIRIGYIPADTDDAAFRDAITAITGGPVDYVDARNSTPTLLELEASYDCVFTHPDFSYADSVGFGDALAGYVDGGGNVVLGIATDYAPPTGLSTSMIMQAAYAPINTSGSVAFMSVTYAGDGTTPIHTSIGSYGVGIYDIGVALQGTGIQESTYDDGTIASAYRPDFKVVYLNGTGNVSLMPMGEWPRLVANACAVGFLQ
jgi:cysteine-rich repeat protein